jgi:predicted aldo/keto reductase-like oxidoreductase
MNRSHQLCAIFFYQLHAVVLNGLQIFASRNASDIVASQAQFDGQIATNGASTHDGYAQ